LSIQHPDYRTESPFALLNHPHSELESTFARQSRKRRGWPYTMIWWWEWKTTMRCRQCAQTMTF